MCNEINLRSSFCLLSFRNHKFCTFATNWQKFCPKLGVPELLELWLVGFVLVVSFNFFTLRLYKYMRQHFTITTLLHFMWASLRNFKSLWFYENRKFYESGSNPENINAMRSYTCINLTFFLLQCDTTKNYCQELNTNKCFTYSINFLISSENHIKALTGFVFIILIFRVHGFEINSHFSDSSLSGT